MTREFHLIVFGATGFTGRLVADYLAHAYGSDSGVRWAMAGRDIGKLTKVRDAIGAPASVALLQADVTDTQAMHDLVRRAAVVLTTVGPYQLYGNALVRACAQAGTDYVDLCGEPAWMAGMIGHLQEPARQSGARIVFSCGFDSIPFDLGVAFLQRAAVERFGQPLARVHGRVRKIRGGISGGTLASAFATLDAARSDPALTEVMRNPFALTPGFTGPPQPAGNGAEYDELACSWTAPFMMAAINTKNVHRTNALLGHAWGRDFVYDERVMAGDGTQGRGRAVRMAAMARVQEALIGFTPTRSLLRRFALPQPGEGPDAQARENGRYELWFSGRAANGSTLRAVVRGDRDPGYGSTSKMIAEAALCLVGDHEQKHAGGGVWTPGSALGEALQARLQAHAGLTFAIDDGAR